MFCITRWMSREQCLLALERSWIQILEDLHLVTGDLSYKKEEREKTSALLDEINCYSTVAFFEFFLDILPRLSQTWKIFQSRSCTIYEVERSHNFLSSSALFLSNAYVSELWLCLLQS